MSDNLPAPAAQPSGNDITPAYMLQHAVANGADLDRLERLMDLQLRWEAEQAKRAFYAALADFKLDPPKLVKNATVDFTSKTGRTHYKHATLDSVSDPLVPALAKHGLSSSWNIEQNENGIRVTCELAHRDGHTKTVALYAKADDSGTKNPIQALGSAITYLERYTLQAATGLATGEGDDDGRASGRPIAEERKAEPRQRHEYQPAQHDVASVVQSHSDDKYEAKPTVHVDVQPPAGEEGQNILVPGKMYQGMILAIEERANNAKLIRIALSDAMTEDFFFFHRPAALKAVPREEWSHLCPNQETGTDGAYCSMSFTEKRGQDGKLWRYVNQLDIEGVEVPEKGDGGGGSAPAGTGVQGTAEVRTVQEA